MAYEIDMDQNSIDTTKINNVLDHLPLFLLAKSVLVTVVEESWHILLLSAKYHAAAAGIFLFSIFFPIFLFLFEDLIMRCPKRV